MHAYNGNRNGVDTPRERVHRTLHANPGGGADILFLQQAIGNRVVSRMVSATGRSRQSADPNRNPKEVWDLSHWQGQEARKENVGLGRKGGTGRTLDELLKNNTAQGILEELRTKQSSSSGKLAVYRTLEDSEANEILEWKNSGKLKGTEEFIENDSGGLSATRYHAARKAPGSVVGGIPVGGYDASGNPKVGHAGDWSQAYRYYKGRRSEGKVVRVFKFTFKKGAHELLFTPEYMALGSPAPITNAIQNRHPEQTFPRGSDNEGARPGYIGLKPEQHGDFSLAVGGPEASRLLFQFFLENVEEVTNKARNEMHYSEPAVVER